MLLYLRTVNGYHIIYVLKATCHLNAFASKYIDCLFYGSICGGIRMCMVLDVFRPRRKPGRRGWRACSGWGWGEHRLLVADSLWVFEEPLAKTSVLASSIHHPVEDTHWRSHLTMMRTYPLGPPGFGRVCCSSSPYLKLHRGRQVCHFRACSPPASANAKPREVPRSMNIPTEMQSSGPPTLCEGG